MTAPNRDRRQDVVLAGTRAYVEATYGRTYVEGDALTPEEMAQSLADKEDGAVRAAILAAVAADRAALAAGAAELAAGSDLITLIRVYGDLRESVPGHNEHGSPAEGDQAAAEAETLLSLFIAGLIDAGRS